VAFNRGEAAFSVTISAETGLSGGSPSASEKASALEYAALKPSSQAFPAVTGGSVSRSRDSTVHLDAQDLRL
jgi:hypothetical protein